MKKYNMQIQEGSTYGNITALKFIEKLIYKQNDKSCKKGYKNRNVEKWLFKCNCGKEFYDIDLDIKRGKKFSCGCGERLNYKKAVAIVRLPFGESSKRKIYDRYKRQAGIRGLSFELNMEEFSILTKGDCYYCGLNPVLISKPKDAHGEYIYNGIDRIDSDKGYSFKNCVSCCKYCNRAKSDQTLEEFNIWLNRIFKHNNLK